MDALDALMTRSSIRSFTTEDVDDEAVAVLLKAAMAAPSACNQQPWSFVVVRDRAVLDAVPSFHPFARMLFEAPLAVAVCATPSMLPNDVCAPYWEQDCGAATQSLLLAAHALGLGAVWLGAHPSLAIVEGLRGLLNLPPEVIPFALVAVGHPAERKGPSRRYDPSRIHENRWGVAWGQKGL